MKEVLLTNGHVAFVDDEDYEHVMSRKWRGARSGRATKIWYAVAFDKRLRPREMHRFILNPPDGVKVDHKDGNGLNNTRQNIRLATDAQNAQNRRPGRNNTSGYKGVTFHKQTGKWQAKIGQNKRKFYLGLFLDPLEAARAYDAAALEMFGEFAYLNLGGQR